MKKLKYLLLLLLALHLPAFAAPAKPSEASIRELLTITKSQKLIDTLFVQIDAQLKSAIQKEFKGKTLNGRQQQVVDRMHQKMMIEFRQTLGWESLVGIYLRVYSEAFTQEEIDGMLAFYRTPAGQAVINKLPVLMSLVIKEMAARTEAFKPRLEQIVNEAIKELKTAEE